MALTETRPVGIGGLDLGVDTTLSNRMRLADGARYLEDGAVHSRGGRRRAGLVFPDEGIGTPASYMETIDHYRVFPRCRGIAAFYDQRIEVRYVTKTFTPDHPSERLTISGGHGLVAGDRVRLSTTNNLPTGLFSTIDYWVIFEDPDIIKLSPSPSLTPTAFFSDNGVGTHSITKYGEIAYVPQRLNFLAKNKAGKFQMNNDLVFTGGFVEGDGNFNDPDTRAKMVVHGDRAYVIDESTNPKVFQRRPIAEQVQYARVKYDIRDMGIKWPTSSVFPACTSPGGIGIPNGTYRAKIILENKNGSISNPSIAGVLEVSGAAPATYMLVDWTSLIGSFPIGANAPNKVNLYVSYTAEGSVQTEPSDYLFVRSQNLTGDDQPGDPDGSMRYTISDHRVAQSKPLMPISQGYPPRLLDMVVVNQTPVAIPMPDTIFREVATQQSPTSTGAIGISPQWWDQGRGMPNDRNRIGPRLKLVTGTEIRPIRLDSSYIMWGDPGETEYLEYYTRIARGNEVCVGLAVLGQVAVVFTNVGIYTFDPLDPNVKQVPSKVGCMSRDSIVETESGIVFMASDGIPRLFNGATVDELSHELLPIFDRDDYVGDYMRFDRTYAHEVNGCFAKRRTYMTYPASNTPGGAVPSKPQVDSGVRDLMVGDQSRGRTQWAIDKQTYDYVQWLGREGRILGIDMGGSFYYIDEGLEDQGPLGTSNPITFDWKVRKIPVGGFQVGDVYRLGIDIDTQGETVACHCVMDDNPAIQFGFLITTTRRDQVFTYLPANFWGRLLTVRISGIPESARVALYGVTIESDMREVQ